MSLLSLSSAAANILVASVLQGLLLVLAVSLMLRIAPRIPAASRSLIWSAVFALILAVPFLPTRPTLPTHALSISPVWAVALGALWLTLSVIRAVQFVIGVVALHRLVLTAKPVESPTSGAPDSCILCTSPLVACPSVVGFSSRRILLPPELYASLTRVELRHVILHEVEHLRRRDDWTNLLQKLALILIPLNPVLFWVERRLCLERELACDDRVLRATGTPKAYATSLTRLAEQSLLSRGLSLALGFFERQSELSRRVHRLLYAPRMTMSRRQTALATSMILIGLAGGSVSLTHAPQLVRFAAPSSSTAALARNPAPGDATFRVADLRVPVSGSANTPGGATLIRASMPVRAGARPIRRVKRRLPRTGSPRVLRTEWSTDRAPRAERLVLTPSGSDQISYTFTSTVAIVTPRGWIIFQL